MTTPYAQLGDGKHIRKQSGTVNTPQTIEFNPNHCLPPVWQRGRFYRDEGSLTSGDLSESASWLVFERPVLVIEKDIRKIRETSEQTLHEREEVDRRVILRSFL